MISHINGIHLHPYFHVSQRTAEKLETLIRKVQMEQIHAALDHLPLAVIETCNSQGTSVNEAVLSQIRGAILSGLSMADGTELSVKFALPAGVEGALAKLGPDAWIFVTADADRNPTGIGQAAQTQISLLQRQINRLRVAIHEMEHLIDKLRQPRDEHKPRAAF